MTYKEAREYLIPVAANCVLPQYAAALEKAIEALEIAESVVRCEWCAKGTLCCNAQGEEYVDCAYDDSSVRKPMDFCSYGERRADNV